MYWLCKRSWISTKLRLNLWFLHLQTGHRLTQFLWKYTFTYVLFCLQTFTQIIPIIDIIRAGYNLNSLCWIFMMLILTFHRICICIELHYYLKVMILKESEDTTLVQERFRFPTICTAPVELNVNTVLFFANFLEIWYGCLLIFMLRSLRKSCLFF